MAWYVSPRGEVFTYETLPRGIRLSNGTEVSESDAGKGSFAMEISARAYASFLQDTDYDEVVAKQLHREWVARAATEVARILELALDWWETAPKGYLDDR